MPKRKSKLRWKKSFEGFLLFAGKEPVLSVISPNGSWWWRAVFCEPFIFSKGQLELQAPSKDLIKRACKLLVEAMLRGRK